MTTTIIYRINTNNAPEKLFHFYSYAMLDYPIVRVRENTALKLNYFILASACSLSIFGENNDLDSAILVFRNMFFFHSARPSIEHIEWQWDDDVRCQLPSLFIFVSINVKIEFCSYFNFSPLLACPSDVLHDSNNMCRVWQASINHLPHE